MAKDVIDSSETDKAINDLKKALVPQFKGALAGYLSHDKGKKPYKEPNAPFIEKIAEWNEFGTENIPARPFMRRAQKQSNDRLPKKFKQMIDDGYDLDTAMKQMGVLLQAEIKKQISRGTFTPNAPSTIARKGSSRPLVDTGNLLQSVHWGLVHKNGTQTVED